MKFNKIFLLLPFLAISLSGCGTKPGDGEIPNEEKLIVKWVDYDGTVLQEDSVEKFATNVEFKGTIPKHDNAKFIGWDKEIYDFWGVTENMIITAQYIGDYSYSFKKGILVETSVCKVVAEDIVVKENWFGGCETSLNISITNKTDNKYYVSCGYGFINGYSYRISGMSDNTCFEANKTSTISLNVDNYFINNGLPIIEEMGFTLIIKETSSNLFPKIIETEECIIYPSKVTKETISYPSFEHFQKEKKIFSTNNFELFFQKAEDGVYSSIDLHFYLVSKMAENFYLCIDKIYLNNIEKEYFSQINYVPSMKTSIFDMEVPISGIGISGATGLSKVKLRLTANNVNGEDIETEIIEFSV